MASYDGLTTFGIVKRVMSEVSDIDEDDINPNDQIDDLDEVIENLEEIYDIEFSLLHDDISTIRRVSDLVKMIKEHNKQW